MLIRYYGHVGGRTGYGEAGTGLCRSILAAGFDLDIGEHGALAGWEGDALPLRAHVSTYPDGRVPDLLLFHYQPRLAVDMLERVRMGWPQFANVRTAIYTTYEGAGTMQDARLIEALKRFDLRLAPTPAHGGEPFMGYVPHAYNADREHAQPTTPAGRYRFYYRGDVSERKNLRGLLCAYAYAFDQTSPVELTLYTRGLAAGEMHELIASTGIDWATLAPIAIVPGDLSPADRDASLRNHDCFVTASHGEAWGLAAFEAVLAGKYVISPQGLGSDHFLAATNAHLVKTAIDLVCAPAGRRPQGLSCRDLWRNVDLAALAGAMQYAASRRPIPTRSAAFKFDYATVGNQLKQALTL